MKKGSQVQSRELTMAKGKVSLRGLGSTRAVLEDFQTATLKSQNQSIKEKGKHGDLLPSVYLKSEQDAKEMREKENREKEQQQQQNSLGNREGTQLA